MSSINLGLGYCIAIALAFLVLLSILLLISYHCHRHLHNHNNNNNNTTLTQPQHSNVVVLPRILFVSEDTDEDSSSTTTIGLHPQVINSYPKFPYNKDSTTSTTATAENTRCCCSICLCEYKELEMLRMMPECKHVFHMVCVDAWLKLNGSCPVCRNSPLPTPMSTPLSEVVPLSQYDRLRR